MYKFLCSNITKSRGFTNAYKRIALNKKYHLEGTKSQDIAQANGEEKDEEHGQPNRSSRPSTCPPTVERMQFSSKIPKIRELRSAASLNYSKFYTGNFLKVIPRPPSISKKYFHVYNITSIPPRRFYSSNSSYFRHFLSEDVRKNYQYAMEKVREIQNKKDDFQWKPPVNPLNKTTIVNSDEYPRKLKKKPSKTDITYPTHTIRHNLTLAKRYRIREGSVQNQVDQDLEEQFRERKLAQANAFKPSKPKQIVYPSTSATPTYKKIKKAATEDSPKKIEPINVEKDFESLIKSHPTIQNASKEVKMKLKTKFIQLLLKHTPGVPRKQVQKEETEVVKKDTVKDNLVSAAEDKDDVILVGQEKILNHPGCLAEEINYNYPKTVWVDTMNDYDIDKVCIRENMSKMGTGCVPKPEEPTLDHKKVEKEAAELSNFIKLQQFRKCKHDSIASLKQGTETPGVVSLKLEDLKKERLRLMKELDKVIKMKTAEEAKIRQKKETKIEEAAAVRMRPLEEPDGVEKLNEIARKQGDLAYRRKIRKEERMRHEEDKPMRQGHESIKKNIIDDMAIKIIKGEEVKKKIERIRPVRKVVAENTRHKKQPEEANKKQPTSLEEPTKYDELNNSAHVLSTKKKKTPIKKREKKIIKKEAPIRKPPPMVLKSYEKEGPKLRKDESAMERKQQQQVETVAEQEEKVKKELDEFYDKKMEEWKNEVVAEKADMVQALNKASVKQELVVEKKQEEQEANASKQLDDKVVHKTLEIREEMKVDTLENITKIDEVIEKIKDLEGLLKKQKQIKIEEAKCGNKARLPPVPNKPPADKDKNVKKEKPKGPKDMVLPPKVRGLDTPTNEKVPKQQEELTSQVGVPTEKDKNIIKEEPKVLNEMVLPPKVGGLDTLTNEKQQEARVGVVLDKNTMKNEKPIGLNDVALPPKGVDTLKDNLAPVETTKTRKEAALVGVILDKNMKTEKAIGSIDVVVPPRGGDTKTTKMHEETSARVGVVLDNFYGKKEKFAEKRAWLPDSKIPKKVLVKVPKAKSAMFFPSKTYSNTGKSNVAACPKSAPSNQTVFSNKPRMSGGAGNSGNSSSKKTVVIDLAKKVSTNTPQAQGSDVVRCASDKNLKHDKPRLKVMIVLPKVHDKKHTKKLGGYGSETRMLQPKQNKENLSKASLYTTPVRQGPKDDDDFKKKKDGKKEDDEEKKAIFRILEDGEVFIVKKAGEKLKEMKQDGLSKDKPRERILKKKKVFSETVLKQVLVEDKAAKAEDFVKIDNVYVKKEAPKSLVEEMVQSAGNVVKAEVQIVFKKDKTQETTTKDTKEEYVKLENAYVKKKIVEAAKDVVKADVQIFLKNEAEDNKKTEIRDFVKMDNSFVTQKTAEKIRQKPRSEDNLQKSNFDRVGNIFLKKTSEHKKTNNEDKIKKTISDMYTIKEPTKKNDKQSTEEKTKDFVRIDNFFVKQTTVEDILKRDENKGPEEVLRAEVKEIFRKVPESDNKNKALDALKAKIVMPGPRESRSEDRRVNNFDYRSTRAKEKTKSEEREATLYGSRRAPIFKQQPAKTKSEDVGANFKSIQAKETKKENLDASKQPKKGEESLQNQKASMDALLKAEESTKKAILKPTEEREASKSSTAKSARRSKSEDTKVNFEAIRGREKKIESRQSQKASTDTRLKAKQSTKTSTGENKASKTSNSKSVTNSSMLKQQPTKNKSEETKSNFEPIRSNEKKKDDLYTLKQPKEDRECLQIQKASMDALLKAEERIKMSSSSKSATLTKSENTTANFEAIGDKEKKMESLQTQKASMDTLLKTEESTKTSILKSTGENEASKSSNSMLKQQPRNTTSEDPAANFKALQSKENIKEDLYALKQSKEDEESLQYQKASMDALLKAEERIKMSSSSKSAPKTKSEANIEAIRGKKKKIESLQTQKASMDTLLNAEESTKASTGENEASKSSNIKSATNSSMFEQQPTKSAPEDPTANFKPPTSEENKKEDLYAIKQPKEDEQSLQYQKASMDALLKAEERIKMSSSSKSATKTKSEETKVNFEATESKKMESLQSQKAEENIKPPTRQNETSPSSNTKSATNSSMLEQQPTKRTSEEPTAIFKPSEKNKNEDLYALKQPKVSSKEEKAPKSLKTKSATNSTNFKPPMFKQQPTKNQSEDTKANFEPIRSKENKHEDLDALKEPKEDLQTSKASMDTLSKAEESTKTSVFKQQLTKPKSEDTKAHFEPIRDKEKKKECLGSLQKAGESTKTTKPSGSKSTTNSPLFKPQPTKRTPEDPTTNFKAVRSEAHIKEIVDAVKLSSKEEQAEKAEIKEIFNASSFKSTAKTPQENEESKLTGSKYASAKPSTEDTKKDEEKSPRFKNSSGDNGASAYRSKSTHEATNASKEPPKPPLKKEESDQPSRARTLEENIKKAVDKLVKFGIFGEPKKEEPTLLVSKARGETKKEEPTLLVSKANDIGKKVASTPTLRTIKEVTLEERKKELERMRRQRELTEHRVRQKERSKKEKVEDINSAAAFIEKQGKKKTLEEMSRGNKRQMMYERDANSKTDKPSVGNASWGVKINTMERKSEESGGNKNLMTKAEFLQLKRKQPLDEKNKDEQLREEEAKYNIEEIKKNLANQSVESKTQQKEEINKKALLSMNKQEIKKNLTESKADVEEKTTLLSKSKEEVKQTSTVSNLLLMPIEETVDIKKNLNVQTIVSKALIKPKQLMSKEEILKIDHKALTNPKPKEDAVVKTESNDKEMKNNLMEPKPLLVKSISQDFFRKHQEAINFKLTKMTKMLVETIDNSKDKMAEEQKQEGQEVKKMAPLHIGTSCCLETVAGTKNDKCGCYVKCVKSLESVETNAGAKGTKKLVPQTPSRPSAEDPRLTASSGATARPTRKFKRSPQKSKVRKSPYKFHKSSYCTRLILPMKSPINQAMAQPLDLAWPSVLEKPLPNAIKTVPREILKIEEAAKRRRNVFDNPDPLSKYKHLKITFMTVKRPKRKQEKFLPAILKKIESGQMSEEERRKIINFRYELLRKLSEEFSKQIQQHPALNQPKTSNFDTKVPHQFDKPTPNVRNVKEMNAVRNLVKTTVAKKKNGDLSINKKKEDGGGVKKKGGDSGIKKGGDDADGVGGSRRFSTASRGGCNSVDHDEPPNKTDPFALIINSQKCPLEEDFKEGDAPDCAGFDIVKEVPHAFECASEHLEPERQKDLYYRYHKHSFNDIHLYLDSKRLFNEDRSNAEKKLK